MARIVGDVAEKKEWAAIIRCAHPSFGAGLHRVDGCFAEIEITQKDITGFCDSDGDWTLWTECPRCGQRLYVEWQIGNGPLEVVKAKLIKRRRTS